MSANVTERGPDRGPEPIAYSYTRFSTKKQKDGSSVERQTRMTREWCERNGYRLADENYEDLGVSAFRGKNRERGELGAFVEAAQRGTFPEGTVLLIENADRLSRGGIWASVTLLKEITECGIDVVFLSSGHRITGGSMDNLNDMVRIIVEAERAAEESRRKSDLLKRAWQYKREKLARDGKRLTGMVPGWLEPIAGDGFKIKPAQAEVVRKMFEWRVQGWGPDKIARALNQDKVPTFRYGKKWTRGVVLKLLESKAPLGSLLYGPGTDPKGKTEIEDYYPPAITRDLWARAQAVKPETPRGGHGGRGTVFSPFSHGLARCGACGASMGTSHTREYRNMVCNAHRAGRPCKGITLARGTRGPRWSRGVPVVELVQALQISLGEVLEHVPSVEAEAVKKLADAKGEVSYWGTRMVDKSLSPAVRAHAADQYDSAENEVEAWQQVLSEAAGPLVSARIARARAALEGSNPDVQELAVALRGVFKRMVFDWPTEHWRAVWRHVDETVEFPATMRSLGFDTGRK